jgi:hypothetical protein
VKASGAVDAKAANVSSVRLKIRDEDERQKGSKSTSIEITSKI